LSSRGTASAAIRLARSIASRTIFGVRVDASWMTAKASKHKPRSAGSSSTAGGWPPAIIVRQAASSRSIRAGATGDSLSEPPPPQPASVAATTASTTRRIVDAKDFIRWIGKKVAPGACSKARHHACPALSKDRVQALTSQAATRPIG